MGRYALRANSFTISAVVHQSISPTPPALLPPEPFHGVGEDAAAAVRVVAVAFGVIELFVVFHVAEGGVHLAVGEGPVADVVVEVAAGVLQEDADGFALGLADERRVGVAAADIGEAADGGEDFAEGLG